jgi:hypothetical protein
MKSKSHNIKTFQIMSDGSLNVSYRTTISKLFVFSEKDYLNFVFNLKNKNINQNNTNSGAKYKSKYVNF